MLKTDKAVIVEGKYDKMRLASVLDALILETDGFGVFTNREKQRFIRRLAMQNGILILTDSDRALLKDVETVKEIVAGVRAVRNQKNIAPKEKLALEVTGKNAVEGFASGTPIFPMFSGRKKEKTTPPPRGSWESRPSTPPR